jgi:hypothetical protein
MFYVGRIVEDEQRIRENTFTSEEKLIGKTQNLKLTLALWIVNCDVKEYNMLIFMKLCTYL